MANGQTTTPTHTSPRQGAASTLLRCTLYQVQYACCYTTLQSGGPPLIGLEREMISNSVRPHRVRPTRVARPTETASVSEPLAERTTRRGAGRGAGRGAVITQHQACSTGRGRQCGMDHTSGVCKSRSEADRVCGCGPSTSSTFYASCHK